jgi:hypothetical protein
VKVRASRSLVALAIVLTACGHAVWKLPEGVSDEKFRRENYECERDAAMLPRGNIVQLPSFKSASRELYEKCMESKGYRQQ